MAWIAGLAVAGAGIVGDVMSQSGQQQTNQMNQANMLQQEQWQEQMSDTAMQRRVADLKAAGLNPMLATGTSGAQVGGVGLPSIQNPSSSFSGLGGQAQSAVSTAQQVAAVDQTRAQTDLIRAQTPGNVITLNDDGTPDFTRANGGILGNLNAAQLMTQVQQGNALVSKIKQDTETSRSQMDNNEIQNALQGINVGILKQTRDWLVQQQIADAKIDVAAVPAAQAQSAIYSGQKGAWIAGLEKAIQAAPMIGSAIGSTARGLLSGPAQITNIRR